MATHTAQFAKHATLSAATVDTITLSGCYAGIIRVRNLATSGAALYFKIYPPSDPVKTAPASAANDTYVVPFGDLCDIANSMPSVVVKVISADTQAYSVESISGLN